MNYELCVGVSESARTYVCPRARFAVNCPPIGREWTKPVQERHLGKVSL